MRPNFRGTWKLIRGESDFGFLPPPRLRVDTILHDDARLRIQTHQKDSNGSITVVRDLTIDNPPFEISIHGRPRWVRAFWEDATLVVETSSEVSGNARQILDRWTLDPDAAWLTIQRTHEQPGGAVHQRLRLQRQLS